MIKPLRHLVLRGAADPERRARRWRSFAARPAWRWPAARTRGWRSASAICWLREAIDYAAAQRGDHRRLHAMREDRRAGGRLQRVDRQRRRLGLPQHAPAGRRRRTARWSSTTIWRSNCASRSTATCRNRRTAAFTMPEAPGLGFEPDRDAIREIAKLPLSQGRRRADPAAPDESLIPADPACIFPVSRVPASFCLCPARACAAIIATTWNLASAGANQAAMSDAMGGTHDAQRIEVRSSLWGLAVRFRPGRRFSGRLRHYQSRGRAVGLRHLRLERPEHQERLRVRRQEDQRRRRHQDRRQVLQSQDHLLRRRVRRRRAPRNWSSA